MLHHSAMPPDDLPESRAIRFHFRGSHDLVECLVSWRAIDRLENRPAATRAERLARFEQHRTRIEEVALRKLDAGEGAGGPLVLDESDLVTAG